MIDRRYGREILGELGAALAELRASAASEFFDVTGIATLAHRIIAFCEGLRSSRPAGRKS